MLSIAVSAIPVPAIPSPRASLLRVDTPAVVDSEPLRAVVIGTSWRCRLGFHRWIPLPLSLSGARRSLGISLCCRCPAVHRPA